MPQEQPYQSLQNMLASEGWRVFTADITERLQQRLNTLLQTDDASGKLRGEIIALRWVLDRPHVLVTEAEDLLKRAVDTQLQGATEAFLLEHGRNSPIPPPNVARPEIK